MRHGRGGGGLRRPHRRYRQDQRGRTRHPPHARPVLGRGRRWSRCSWTGRRRDRRSDPGGCRADHQHQRHQRLEPVRPRRQRPGQAGHRSEGRARAEHPGRGLRRVRGGAQPRPRSSGRPAGHRLRPLRFYPLPRRVRGSRRGRQRHPVGQSARADQHAGGHPREHGASTSDSARHLAPTQAVPTSVRVGPDGALYVSELSGFAGSANVLRVVPGHAPTSTLPASTRSATSRSTSMVVCWCWSTSRAACSRRQRPVRSSGSTVAPEPGRLWPAQACRRPPASPSMTTLSTSPTAARQRQGALQAGRFWPCASGADGTGCRGRPKTARTAAGSRAELTSTWPLTLPAAP